MYPLERIHVDLCEMTREHGKSPYKYILFAVDNYSRYAFFVLLKNKTSPEMENAATQLLQQTSKFRTLSFNQSSVFMSDLGTEFVTSFKRVLLSRGHFFVNLATSQSKAFYVERFIRTFRTLLRIKQTSLDLDNRDFERWDTLVGDILETYNCTPHKSLQYSSPLDYITLKKKTIAQPGGPRGQPHPPDKSQFLASLKQYSSRVPFKIGDHVNITLAKKNVFAKGSEQTRVGLEVFRVAKIRPPILNQSKLSYYFLEDLTGKPITGAFYESNLVLIPPSSKRHPLNPRFKKTIARVLTTRKKPGGETYYTVTYTGKIIIL